MRIILLPVVISFALSAPASGDASDRGAGLAAAALEQTKTRVVYDPAYRRLRYPMGDVAADRGVCADVIVRALRATGRDLQALVHDDMKADFGAYPRHWGLKRPDPNIDHRRVPNLETYFRRAGYELPASKRPRDYKPGDIVAWNLKGDDGLQPHIGIVTATIGASGRPMVVHNIGAGPQHEDVLFAWPVTGHFRL